MANTFKFPDVGEGITEGEIVRWLVKEGDEVRPDQPLAEVETDKAVVEMPSPYAGTVLKLHHREKDVVKVGDALVTIGAKGESPEAAAPPVAPAVAAAAAAPATAGPEFKAAPPAAGRPMTVPPPAAGAGAPARLQATPRVRKMAEEMGVDLASVRGTGPEGRVTEEDVKAAKERPAAAAPTPAPVAPAPAAPAGEAAAPKVAVKFKSKYDFYGTIDRIPLRGVRRATAKRMRQSLDTAAHVTHFDEADASALARLRDRLAPEGEPRGVKLTYLPFIVKAAIEALRLHPTLNASLDDEEEEIILKKYYNIGIAVDVPDGLIVPVVKEADSKGLFELAGEIAALAKSARERSLDLADLKGGTFTITNVGIIGGEAATPIINYPEVAILATMRIGDRVRAENGSVVVRKTLPLCLSFDHRVIDGAEAARFSKDLVGFIEDPSRLL